MQKRSTSVPSDFGDGSTVLIHDVLHDLGIRCNLFSVSKLLNLGLGVDFWEDKVFISSDIDKLIVGLCHNGLFCVDMNIGSSIANKRYSYSANFVHVENDSIMWHTRLGHMGLKG